MVSCIGFHSSSLHHPHIPHCFHFLKPLHTVLPPIPCEKTGSTLCGIEVRGVRDIQGFSPKIGLLNLRLNGWWWELEEDAKGFVSSKESVRSALGLGGPSKGEDGLGEFCEERADVQGSGKCENDFESQFGYL